MKQYIIRHVVMISENQHKSLTTLKKYDVNVSKFIRQAIKEKLSRDWNQIKETKEKIKLNF